MSRILTFAASFRDGSTNQKLVDIAANMAEADGATIAPICYRDISPPLLRDDAPTHPLPEGVQQLSVALHEANGFMIATPEFNWSIPGALKNLIDWLSIDASLPLKGKTALLLCASPSLRGGIMGLSHLRTPLELMGVHVYPQVIGLGRAHEVIAGGTITDEKEQTFLQSSVKDFVRVTKSFSM